MVWGVQVTPQGVGFRVRGVQVTPQGVGFRVRGVQVRVRGVELKAVGLVQLSFRGSALCDREISSRPE